MGTLAVIPLVAFTMFLINQTIIRFADVQSMILLYVTVLAYSVVVAQPSMLSLIALFLAANPLPAMIGTCDLDRDRTMVRTQVQIPFDHIQLTTAFERFLDLVPANSNIYFAFDDPGEDYDNIFDGYRLLVELPFFVAASRGIHLFPDWWAVGETNHLGAVGIWGRTVAAVITNTQRWKAAYVIVYQNSGDNLDDCWLKAGFSQIASFDWQDWVQYLRGQKLWTSVDPPHWWLLKSPMVSAENH